MVGHLVLGFDVIGEGNSVGKRAGLIVGHFELGFDDVVGVTGGRELAGYEVGLEDG